MRHLSLFENFEQHATWWLPSGEGNRVRGTLRYARETIELKVYGEIVDDARFREFEVIHGQAGSTKLTLLNCRRSSHSNASDTYATAEYSPQFVLIGLHVQEVDLQKFDGAVLRYTGLEHWLDAEAFTESNGRRAYPFMSILDVLNDGQQQTGNFGQPTFSISHSYPRFPRVTVPSLEAQIGVTSEVRQIGGDYDLRLRHQSFLTIHPNAPQGLIWFLETHVQLMRMLSFFCEGQIQTRSFSLQIANESSTEEAALLWRTGQGPDAGDPGALIMPVRYSAIKDEFPGILEKWFKNATRMRHVYDLFFAAMHRPGWFSDQDFLQLVQAIEVFSRITTDSSYLPVEQYELVRSALTNAIPAGIDASLREALKSRIKFGNGFSMRKRVTELLKNLDVETIALFTRDPRSFISRVVATRNYLVHLDETTKEDPYDDDELLAAILSLRIMLSVLLLKELGFNESRARDIIRGSLLGSGLTLATLQPPPSPPPSPAPPPPAA